MTAGLTQKTPATYRQRAQRPEWVARLRHHAPTIAIFVVGLLLWEVLVSLLSIPGFLLPSPSAIGSAFIAHFDELKVSGRMTLYESAGGLAIGGLLGVSAALVAVRWRVAGKALIPFAVAFNAVPTIIFAPIMNNWFGSINPLSNMMVVVTLVYYPILINIVRGLTQIDPAKHELLQALGASNKDVFIKLRVPNALPYLFNALKLGATLSVIGTVVAGYFGGPRAALGVWILNQAVYFRFPVAWAGISVAIAVGLSFYIIVTALERIVMPWHESVRGE